MLLINTSICFIILSAVATRIDSQLFGMSAINRVAYGAFLKLFAVEENYDLLQSFVNSILSEEDAFVNITIKPEKQVVKYRAGILDVRGVTKDDRRIHVEFALKEEKRYTHDKINQWGTVYSKRFNNLFGDVRFYKAVFVLISNLDCNMNSTSYHTVLPIADEVTGANNTFDKLELHVIELVHFCEDIGLKIDKVAQRVKTKLDVWVTLLTRSALMERRTLPKVLDHEDIHKALEVIAYMKF